MSPKCIIYIISRFIKYRKIKAIQKIHVDFLPEHLAHTGHFHSHQFTDKVQLTVGLFPGSAASNPMDSPQKPQQQTNRIYGGWNKIPIVHISLCRSFVESSPQGVFLHSVFGFILRGGKWINTAVSDSMIDEVRKAIF